MEFYAYPSPSRQPSSPSDSSSSSSSSSLSSFGIWVERTRWVCRSMASAILCNRLSAIFTFFFALVFLRLVPMELVRGFCLFGMGSLLGAVTGALLGKETESGFFHGGAIGAIYRAVFSIDVSVSSLHLWHSEDSGLGFLLYLIDVIASLLSGRLVRVRIDPAMLSAVQSQMGAGETSFDDVTSFFGTGGTRGLWRDSIEKIPKIKITGINNVDACSVCLQDFQVGETVRSLPHCHHMFHLPCIDGWLGSHGSCPLCRRSVMLIR